jgi:thymidylate synthase
MPKGTIWVVGGKRIYEEALQHPSCRAAYVTLIPGDHMTDVTVEMLSVVMANWKRTPVVEHAGLCFMFERGGWKAEEKYLRLLSKLLVAPIKKNRTGIDCRSLFGCMLKYPLYDEFGNHIIPLFTTKRVPLRLVLSELLWFISGGTNVDALHAANNHIWDGNSSREYLDGRGLAHYEVGELGPVYGFQWRHYGAQYVPESEDQPTTYAGIDQLQGLIDGIKADPFGRRHVMTAWNPADLDKMALPPCHHTVTVVVSEVGDKKHLRLLVDMRSNDMFLGHPFNAASYGLFAHMIAVLSGCIAVEVALVAADTHLYVNHVEAVQTQLQRSATGPPIVRFAERCFGDGFTIDDFTAQDIEIVGYNPAGTISAEMAV